MTQPLTLTGQVLHHLTREGRAVCGAYTRPHLITGDESDCPACRELLDALTRMRAGNRSAGKPLRRRRN